MTKTVILAIDGVFDTGLAAFQDTLATASELAEPNEGASFSATVLSVRRGVRTAHGLTIPTKRALSSSKPDLVLVPALGAKTDEALTRALRNPDIDGAKNLLRTWHAQGATIAAACTGTFVLAETGLLDGKSATTSWWLASFFRSRYPQVALENDRTLVRTERLVTAGAVLAHFDLALWFIRQHSPSLAAVTARYLMLDPRSPQATYAIPDHVRHADEAVHAFESWARANLENGFSLEDAARFVGVSARTLSRKIHAVLGRSPLAYHQDLRVERASYLLSTTQLSVDEIAVQTGYVNAATLRTLLRRKTGRTASELRRINELKASD
ncbi:AraC family transcriptional regulator [Bradyrhizobium sp. LTSP849]|uniref:GlxA family transcriptional regulator n=1 Tax=Bradyrhizobium sp. LTSP849 TaxID=1615890 RepID=UPI0005D232A2|nr:helix-turn-helix domain-containing protein [Bradyrhizobium sp. LTSP849]KJC41738.1 AraC family transcriptional regulator [Bradyrhizobium sp. LTSP849]